MVRRVALRFLLPFAPLLVAAACDPPDCPGYGAPAPTCGVDGGAQCSDDPWSCAPGTTCWVTEKTDNAFSCLRSVSGARDGAFCDSVLGEARCDDGYLCFTASAAAPGTCIPYCSPCDPAHACAAGTTCKPVAFGGSTTVHACVP